MKMRVISDLINEDKYSSEYKRPENYISRKVGPFDIVQRGGISLVYNMKQMKSLYDLLSEEKRIVLLGEAGSGKSYELENLTYTIAKSEKAHPVFVELNNYVDEEIEEWISMEIGDEHKDPMVLVFDGYDEIQGQHLNNFARKMNRFAKKNPEQKIVISTRNNFYRNASDKTKGGILDNFYECSLCPLDDTDIDSYLKSNKIERNLFLKEVKNKNLKEQIRSPFYLVQLAKLFQKTGSLPEIDQLMKGLIEGSFEWDKNKYIRTTKDLEDGEREARKSLECLAFAMQCMIKTSLSSEEYQELVSSGEREIIKYCGVWKKTQKGQHEFEHNNFREYLAAEFISVIPLCKVVELVTYKGNRQRIKDSWINVLSFAVMIDQTQELSDWVIKTEPSIMVKFESSRLTQDRKTTIFHDIMEKYKEDNVWISRGMNNEEDLAKFGQSEKSISYLLEEIRNPCHFQSQSNAIHMIGHMSDYFGKTEEARAVLLDCCFNESTRSYEIAAAITALTNHALYNEEVAQKLLNFFSENYDSDIRKALYRYISENRLQDDTVGFVLDGMKDLNCYDTETYGMRRDIKGILASLEKYESIKKVLDFLLEKTNCHWTMELFQNSLEGLFSKAETFFEEGKQDVLLCVQNIFWKSSITCEIDVMRSARNFLLNTKQIFRTYEWILQQPYNIYTGCILENIMDERCIDDFADKYKNNLLPNRDMFVSFVKRSRNDSYKKDEFVKLVFQVDAIEITKESIIDCNKIREEGEQKYFEALFDQNAFQKLIVEIAELYNGEETTYKDLEEMGDDRTKLRYDLKKVKWALVRNNFHDEKVIHFLSHISCWEDFSISEIYKEIKEKNSIKIRDFHIDYIKNYCLRTMDQIDFEKEIDYAKDGNVSPTMRCIYCVFFANHFALDYPERIIENMLLIAPCLFEHDEKKNFFCRLYYRTIGWGCFKETSM